MKSATNRIPSAATPPASAQTPTGRTREAQGPAAAPEAQSAGSARSARGTVRGRLAQLLDIKKVQHEPAVSVAQWDEAAALEICERWVQGQRLQPSVVGLSRLMALNLERARPDSIPAELKSQRLLPEGADDATYYREMIATFLKTVGLDDADAVADSFKKAGTGGLHRQRTAVAAAASGAFSVAQLAASASLPAKTALSAIQVLMTALTTELGLESANLRFRNSGTEEIMPLGKADASPSAKTGPNVMQAATRVAWDLNKVRHAVRNMESAQAAVDDARARLSNPNATATQRQQAEKDLHAAGQDLAIAHARYCMRAQLKADYKTASESAKIEYHGNKRALGVSVASSAASMTATVLGILTPVVVSSAVTAGATAAAVALAATLYVGYQLSSGPSKDGEDKANRAIVALAKSLDLLAGNAAKQQMERGQAYRTYIAEKRAIGKPEVRKQAKAKLLATLDEIARRDTVKDDLDPVQNWKDYAAFRGHVAQASTDDTAVAALEEAFTRLHASQFKTATLSDGWKTPERMRFDSMGRVLLGKVTESLVSLHDFNAPTGRGTSRDPRLAAASRAQSQGRRAEVKASLRDWLHFELAQTRMKAALAEQDPAQTRTTLQAAASALAAIENRDARDLFSSDARKQVEATKLAKANTIGERERYTMTNAGPTALAGAVNAFGATAGLALTIEKDIAVAHGMHPEAKYGDQNDARLLAQGSAPVTAPYSAAERARFQKTGMSQLVDTLKREGDPVVFKLDLSAANTMLLDLSDRHNDAALDKLLDTIEASKDVPEEIQISLGGAKLASAKLSGTTGYYDWRYRQAPLATKAKFVARKAKMFTDSVGVSVASPIAQVIAQVPLSTTRRAVDRGNRMSPGVRERLTDLATGKTAEDGPRQQAIPPAEDDAPRESTAERDDSLVEGQTPEGNAAAARGNAPSPTDTPARDHAPAPGDAPIAEESAPSPMFDPRAATLALREIPELGHSARVTHSETPAARPEAAFRPRPAEGPTTASTAEAPTTNPALDDQRRMMMGEGRAETLQWFDQRGIRAAYNSGSRMDCLIISLLQHATGRYDSASEPELARMAAHYRAQLAQTYPEIQQGDRMLYDDELAFEALIRTVNRDYRADMNVQLITPSSDGPVRFQTSELGTQPVGIVMFGNHFQAVHQPADAVRETREGEAKAEGDDEVAADPMSPRDTVGASDARGSRHATEQASETTDVQPRQTDNPDTSESLASRAISRADEWRVSGLASERARTRLGSGRRTSETLVAPTVDEQAFVRTPKRDSKAARKNVASWLEANPRFDSTRAIAEDGFIATPKRDSKAARKNVKAWLEASPHPNSAPPLEEDGFVRTPKRKQSSVRRDVKAWLEASPRPAPIEPPKSGGFIQAPKRNQKSARSSVEAWLAASPDPASLAPIDERPAASAPERGRPAVGPSAQPWWQASPNPDSEEVIGERIKAMFDSAPDQSEQNE